MGEGAEPSKTLRFGVFEVNLRAGELRKGGLKVRLQEQPFRVLGMLLERPGKVVMREELQKKLWPGDTFVDFDNGLNTAINKIRDALGDSAETPRYVETLPRRGYRFIAPVEAAAEPAVHPASRDVAAGSSRQSDGVVKRLPRRALPWVLAATSLLFAVVAVHLLLLPAKSERAIRFTISPPQAEPFVACSLSPDGRMLAFVTAATGSQPTLLWVRSLDSLAVEPLQGTSGAEWPFWSPDSSFIGFYAGGKLKKVAASGGAVETLCEANGAGATWNRDGTILFTNQGQLDRISEKGGIPTLVAAPDPAHPGTNYAWPQFLPDGQHYLFIAHTVALEASVRVGTLGSNRTVTLLSAGPKALYATPGYLFYMSKSTLMARPFDAKRLRFTGEATPLVAAVGMSGPGPYAFGYFSASQTGVVAYKTSAGNESQMTWFSLKGKELGKIGQPAYYTNPALSPGGNRLAVGLGVPGNRDIWVYDLKRGTGSRLTFKPADDLNPAWSPDGSRILFTSTRDGQRDIFEKSADGLGNAQPVYASKQQAKSLNATSPDGRYAIYDTTALANLWILPLFGERKPFPFVHGGFQAAEAQFSPNGRYIAYASEETGKREVYVQTFPQHLGKGEVSTSGGMEPMWRRDGKELFYLSLDDRLMAVNVKTDPPPFQAGIPKPLFQVKLIAGDWRNRYVVSPDGQRFLMLVPAGQAKPVPIVVVVNWPALLKKQ
jgi:eukaryotic-like serine/threonine-protein kinase